MERPKDLFYRFVAAASVTRAQAGWILLSVALFAPVAIANPTKLLVTCWIGWKIVFPSLLAAGVFRAFIGKKLEALEGIEATMMRAACVTLMAASVICAGLAP